MPRTCIAVDWSGARVGAAKHIWLAEARDGRLVRLENGRSASELAQELIESASGEPDLVVGLDFAFSVPIWFLDERMLGSAHDLWRLAASDGEEWLLTCEPPFWGRPGRKRPPGELERGYRQNELELRPRPKSVFQVGGSGTVGTGSIRGMPILLQLSEAGFSIWPFDSPAFPMALEIYPRLMTGPVIKSNPERRLEHIADRYPLLESHWVQLAVSSDDAFDAAISALVMCEHAEEFSRLPDCQNPVIRREGRVWHPSMTLPH